jgi:hypothetical protein
LGDKKMTKSRIFRHIVIAVICSIVFVWGCGPQGQKPVTTPTQPKQQAQEAAKAATKQAEPAAKPQATEAATKPAEQAGVKIELKPPVRTQAGYKVMTRVRRSIKWEGPVPEKPAFEESSNDEMIEMAFTQRVQNWDPSGRIIEEAQIDRLKYLSTVKNQNVVDFDSTMPSDSNSPLAKLILQIYSMVVEPNGYIASISGASMIAQLIGGDSAADRIGRHILSSEAVADRHATLLLPRAGEERLKPGDKWSRVKTYSFGRMGIKSYEKIYTLKEIREAAGHKIAVIDMNAIPTSEIEEKYRNQQANADFPKTFDTDETFTGAGEIDLTAGWVNSYQEKLRTSWIAVLPVSSAAKSDDVNEPVVLRLTAERIYDLEKTR